MNVVFETASNEKLWNLFWQKNIVISNSFVLRASFGCNIFHGFFRCNKEENHDLTLGKVFTSNCDGDGVVNYLMKWNQNLWELANPSGIVWFPCPNIWFGSYQNQDWPPRVPSWFDISKRTCDMLECFELQQSLCFLRWYSFRGTISFALFQLQRVDLDSGKDDKELSTFPCS